jgi:hypothetical protein
MSIIQTLINRTDFEAKNGAIVFNRPTTLRLSAMVIAEIKRNYLRAAESGGLLLARPTDKVGFFEVDSLLIIKNNSPFNTKFDPDPAVYLAAINNAIDRGLLPMTYHTHPTSIGHQIYDHKRPNFYVKSSGADRSIASDGVQVGDLKLLLPEAIAVADDRYDEGFKIAFYEGGILPKSYASLSKTQKWAIGGSIVAAVIFGKKLLGLLLPVLAIEEYRRPSYQYNDDGTINVVFRNFL